MSTENEASAEVDVFTLTDEEGEDRDFAFLALITLEQGEFAILAPVDQLDAAEEDPELDLYAFRYTELEDGEVQLDAVEDEELLDIVFEEADRILFGGDEDEDEDDDDFDDEE